MLKSRKSEFIFASLLFLICFFSGSVNWIFQYIVVNFLYLFAGFFIAYQSEHINTKKWKSIMFMTPFLLVYGVVSLNSIYTTGFFATVPIWISGVFSGLLGYFTYAKIKRHKIKGVVSLSIFLAIINFIFIHNWFVFAFEKDFVKEKFPEMSLIDISNKPVNISMQKGNLLVIDLWSTSCGVCIEKFPDYEKLSLKYSDNPNIKFYTLNLPLRRDSIDNASNYVSDYKFESLFTPDKSSWKALQIQKVPQYVIVNKDSEIVYRGRLHDKWYHFYNNIHHLIAKNLE